ncbi:hypothetical protein N7516_003261 [Penicillium verrucosum]|uniref:uncharacterized protein n=1 Tax=Penicillium verrucosum TaxID=60171 RepID=UPI0025451F78|nr:uncharacterized protein N7516_003261 [Penicillium verrucosum]KAJ5943093.1 hypothetical protein N7516_003261 [Penicillium verrucosum]
MAPKVNMLHNAKGTLRGWADRYSAPYPSDVQHGPTEGSWPDVYQSIGIRHLELVFGNETTGQAPGKQNSRKRSPRRFSAQKKTGDL